MASLPDCMQVRCPCICRRHVLRLSTHQAGRVLTQAPGVGFGEAGARWKQLVQRARQAPAAGTEAGSTAVFTRPSQRLHFLEWTRSALLAAAVQQ